MALKVEWIYNLSFLSLVTSLVIVCIVHPVLAQHQNLDVKFVESSIKYAKLDSKTSLTCHINGDVEDLRKIYDEVQIVKVLDGAEEVLTKGETVLSKENYKVEIKFLQFVPSKLYVIFSIPSVQISDAGKFICRLNDLNGTVQKDDVRLKVVSTLDVICEEPSVTYAKLGSKTSLSCSIYGPVQHLRKVYNTIEIVKVVHGDGTVLTKGESVFYHWNQKLEIKYLQFPSSKYHVILTISSVKIRDSGKFFCSFKDLDGTVKKDVFSLVVVKTPDQLVCRKKILDNRIQVTCSAAVFPQGKCDVFLMIHVCYSYKCSEINGVKKNSSIVYDHYQDKNGISTTTCSVDVPKSYVFQIMFAPDIPDPNNFTIFSEKISANPGEANISSFTANNRRSFVVVNYGDELNFSCNASGTIPKHGYLYFKKNLKDSPMKLLTTGKLTEQLKLKLDYVTLDNEGIYTCQPGYEAESSISISVKVEQFNQNDDSDFQIKDWDNRNDGSENQNENCCLPRNIIILTISLSIGGLAIITGIIVFAVFEVRLRRRVRRARVENNNNNIALSVPLVHVAEEVLARCNDQETCLQVSPPPYDLVCNKDDLQDVLPPPYHDVVLSSVSQTDTHSNPMAHLESPPPYSAR